MQKYSTSICLMSSLRLIWFLFIQAILEEGEFENRSFRVTALELQVNCTFKSHKVVIFFFDLTLNIFSLSGPNFKGLHDT